MTAQKVDIFEILRSIDFQKKDWYEQYPESLQKSIPLVVLMMWLACSNNDMQVVITNNNVNNYIFKLYKHPKLIAKLLSTCGLGKPSRYKWIKNDTKKTSTPKSIALLQRYYECSFKEAKRMMNQIDHGDILTIAYHMGYQSEQLKDIQKELK